MAARTLFLLGVLTSTLSAAAAPAPSAWHGGKYPDGTFEVWARDESGAVLGRFCDKATSCFFYVRITTTCDAGTRHVVATNFGGKVGVLETTCRDMAVGVSAGRSVLVVDDRSFNPWSFTTLGLAVPLPNGGFVTAVFSSEGAAAALHAVEPPPAPLLDGPVELRKE
jgi:hypothetical protein